MNSFLFQGIKSSWNSNLFVTKAPTPKFKERKESNKETLNKISINWELYNTLLYDTITEEHRTQNTTFVNVRNNQVQSNRGWGTLSPKSPGYLPTPETFLLVSFQMLFSQVRYKTYPICQWRDSHKLGMHCQLPETDNSILKTSWEPSAQKIGQQSAWKDDQE